ncbi:carbohydrate ABC transporter permease [Caldilinea sp.]|uniref:carbohydrate ABC transporter permease n=1 Tax=Caldilinea sp. TaxID=2293560 RepID=UPI0021DE813A|nr:sugar ABC transporter permease [Caldilinea sp.]GIV70842.1 MAG: spermidine/putrescine ABC transporter permease [Caldilinea sp.]
MAEIVKEAHLYPRGVRPRLSRWRRREILDAYLFISPTVIGLLVFLLGPIIASAVLSFTDYDILTAPAWVGLDNYIQLFQDGLFWQALRVSVIYSVISVPLGLALSLGAALLLNQKIRGVAILRSIYYMPTIISGVAVAMLWRWLFNAQFGMVNILLGKIGIRGPMWLTDERWALTAIIIASFWGLGGAMLIYLAGLQGIPSELYEAAEIDGATEQAKFRYITLPMISHVTFFNLVLGIIGALQLFTDAYVMTGGGPNNATLFLSLYLYRQAFLYLKMGYASAMAWVLFAIVLILTLLVFKSSPMWVYYESERRRAA